MQAEAADAGRLETPGVQGHLQRLLPDSPPTLPDHILRKDYLTQSVFKVVLQTSSPQQIANVSFTITHITNKLTDSCGN